MNNLYILCGIAGCGKSTWVKNRMAENTSSTDHKWEYVSRDEVRFSMIKEEDDYFSKENEVFNKWINNINSEISNDKIDIIYVDATHLTPKARNKVLDKFFRPNDMFNTTVVNEARKIIHNL